MSPDAAVCLAAICVALMVSIIVLVVTVVVIDGFAPQPKHRRPRRSPGAPYWTRAEQADTAAMPIAGWSR